MFHLFLSPFLSRIMLFHVVSAKMSSEQWNEKIGRGFVVVEWTEMLKGWHVHGVMSENICISLTNNSILILFHVSLCVSAFFPSYVLLLRFRRYISNAYINFSFESEEIHFTDIVFNVAMESGERERRNTRSQAFVK